MNDRVTRERSDSEVESTGSDSEGWIQAAAGEWPAWLAAVGAVVVAAYFHLTESIWQTEAEIFYAEIFVLVAVMALGYGLYETHDRAKAF